MPHPLLPSPHLCQHACHTCNGVPHDRPSSSLCAVTANLLMVKHSNGTHLKRNAGNEAGVVAVTAGLHQVLLQ